MINIDFIEKNTNALVLGIIVFSLLFIMVRHICEEQMQKNLQYSLYKNDCFNFDGWSLAHFMMYFFIGFVKPGYTFTAFTAGVMFEVFEDGKASDSHTQLLDCTDQGIKKSLIGKVYCNGGENSYWYGKFDDIIFNLLGYITGQGIRTTFF
jgi:hypothetical protein